jgi:hypothetical protein
MWGLPVSDTEKRYISWMPRLRAFFAKIQINYLSVHAIISLNRIIVIIIIIIRHYQI